MHPSLSLWDLRTQGFLSENCGFGGPLASEITSERANAQWSLIFQGIWKVVHRLYSCTHVVHPLCTVYTQFRGLRLRPTSDTAAAELQDDTTASFSKKTCRKMQKAQLWMKMLKPFNSTWSSKIQAFVLWTPQGLATKNWLQDMQYSENRLVTIHVIELFP